MEELWKSIKDSIPSSFEIKKKNIKEEAKYIIERINKEYNSSIDVTILTGYPKEWKKTLESKGYKVKVGDLETNNQTWIHIINVNHDVVRQGIERTLCKICTNLKPIKFGKPHSCIELSFP